MQKKVVLINNSRQEDMGPIVDSLKACGLACQTIRLDKGEPLPQALEDLSGLVILGGPITVYDQETAPFLKVYFNA